MKVLKPEIQNIDMKKFISSCVFVEFRGGGETEIFMASPSRVFRCLELGLPLSWSDRVPGTKSDAIQLHF